jgi:hypothetical protein
MRTKETLTNDCILVLVLEGKLVIAKFPSMKRTSIEPTTTLDLDAFIVS